MPRARRVCSQPGCPALTDGGRCPDHRREAERKRGSAASRGYDHRWRKTRAAHLTHEPLCCEPGCFAGATDVDHIDGLGPRGPRGHDPANLRSYCHPHHSKRTARDQPGGFRQG